ncbi:MAG TPA: flavodoxin domain-containing protein [Thermoplasmata archaeon]|nr:flavodoxin domain-containing protein [Thermoplasmata archaeon]
MTIVFDTRHGNTAAVAQAIARGLGHVPGVTTQLVFVQDAGYRHLAEADLVVVGGPTEQLGESHHLHQFFSRIGGYDFHGKFGFAFDTHAGSGIHGGAAHGIAASLKRLGVEMLSPNASAITVAGPIGTSDSVKLSPGTEAHFEQLGEELGRALITAAAKRDAANRERAAGAYPAD